MSQSTGSGAGRRVARNSAVRAGGYFLGASLFFVSVILIARYLGATDFGNYSFIMAVAGVFQLVADMGVRNVVIRDLAIDPDSITERLGLARTLLLLMSLVSLLGVVAVAFLLDLSAEVRQAMCLAGLAVMTTFSALGYSSALRAFERMGEDILGFVGHKVLLLVLLLVLTRTSFGLRGVFVANLVANIGLYLYYRIRVTRLHGPTPLSRDLRGAWRLLVESFPLGLAELIRRTTWQIDRLLLTAISGPLAVGLFSSAYKFVEAAKPLAQNLTLPFFPVLARQAREGREEAFASYHRGLKALYVLSAPFAVVLGMLADPIVRGLFGTSYAEAAPAVALLSPVGVLLLPAAMNAYMFTALGLQNVYTQCAAVALTVNVVLDLLLIPQHGFVGAAGATLAAEVSLFLVSAYALSRLGAGSLTLTAPLKPLAACAGPAAVLWFARGQALPWLVLGVAISMLAYVALLALVGGVTRTELDLVRDMFRRVGAPRR